ncbi:VCBS repeat-containing protein, partial [Fibrisoma limi]|uniref:VCBS repeat-containing protein n=1 Tax=Fibrisoma limi TaxID=663275 RepID=UPI000587BD6D
MRLVSFLFIGCVVWLTGCGQRSARFELLSPSRTGVDFTNTITETDSFNVLEFEYIYNGGGVGVGDFNGDGLTDVFFAGNQVSSRMYLNKTAPGQADFQFQDVTEAAGVGTKVWCSGVAVVDINQDGRLDVFVSTLHPDKRRSVPKLLFVNQGNDANGVPRFVESARQVGLADSSFGTQAAFFDYDRDGDLDVYLLTNALEEYNRNTVTGPRNNGSARSVDKLYRNDGGGQGAVDKGLGAGRNDRINPPSPAPRSLPHFTDVSQEAGIIHEGWGLGVIVNDVNQDGWPDIYVANDFQSNDVLYINDQHGHFVNQITDALKHQSHNSMGVDMADINNDGLNEITVVDMMPDDNLRQKTMFGTIPYDKFQMAQRLGYQPQYVRNVLQLNRGFEPGGKGQGARGVGQSVQHSPQPPAPSPTPLFSDIGYMAGIYATDWSWSPLLADFDNDGFRDLLITNGYRRDVTDLDFSTYNREANQFGSDEDRHRRILESLKTLEGVHKPNFMYRNNGKGQDAGSTGLSFSNVAEEWGLDQPSYTNGTAYADFDNDGDLDLVMNNVNDAAFIYRNNTIQGQVAADNAFLRLRLKGDTGNLSGLGATVCIHYQGQMQYAEQVVQRGYQSTVESLMHFGLGGVKQIDSLKIRWPDGRGQLLTNVAVNQVLTLNQAQARPQEASFMLQQNPTSQPLFREVSAAVGLTFRHEETDFVDYKMQQMLLPHKHSQIGPGLAVGDVNGDGLDDVYIAGAAQQSGVLFVQQSGGTFRRMTMPTKDEEETGVLFFDADNDGDQDLYTVRGSTEFGKNQAKFQDQLYLNDGKGHLTPAVNALPPTTASGSCITAGDFDKDGDLDLFIGGRVVPQEYPKPARSYLLRNDSELTSPRPNGHPSPSKGE